MNEEVWLRTPRWIATMSDGRTVDYGDMGWDSLKFMVSQGLQIISLDLAFRNEIKRDILPKNAEGYFFCRGCAANMGEKSIDLYLVGYVKGNQVFIQKWAVPELIKIQEEFRHLAMCSEKCVIMNSVAKRNENH